VSYACVCTMKSFDLWTYGLVHVSAYVLDASTASCCACAYVLEWIAYFLAYGLLHRTFCTVNLWVNFLIFWCSFVSLESYLLLCSVMGIPVGIKSPAGNGDGGRNVPVDVHGDGDGKNSPPRGRRWWLIPRRRIPRCHLYVRAPSHFFSSTWHPSLHELTKPIDNMQLWG
jgi:hypothetical protein